MKRFLLILIVFHGLIHIAGFSKAFNLEHVNIIIQNVSKIFGFFWLAAAILFFITALLLFLNKKIWLVFSLLAVALSQYLVFAYWQDAWFGTVANAIILLGTIGSFISWNFSNKYKREVTRYLKQNNSIAEVLLNEADIQNLPEPVKKYLHYCGVLNKPKVKNFKVEFSGQIRKDSQSEWMPFTSEQYNFVQASTRLFFMNATMKHMPVAGFHCFENGKAFMDIRLLSFFKVQYQSGKEMNISETVTFFNDMCCMAPAALIDTRIQWLETNGNKVKACFTDNNISITAWLYFKENGELINFISDDRFATVNKEMKRFPWSTPLTDYKEFNGHMLASYADAKYHYPDGEFTYGNFKAENIRYNCKE